jgi:Heavy-metal resistance
MNRDRFTLLVFAVVLVALCTLCFLSVGRWRVHRAAHDVDQLSWLRTEFKLSESELSRIRVLHEGYRPHCEEMCVRIAAKKAEVATELANAATLTPAAVAKLKEAAELHAECQAQMLAHFYEVSRAMSPEQGRRYLAEMKRFVLDSPGAAGHDTMQGALPGRSHGHR